MLYPLEKGHALGVNFIGLDGHSSDQVGDRKLAAERLFITENEDPVIVRHSSRRTVRAIA
jgi:hypothetical protein